jgi:tRNA (guanine37-N1)-methyltransferase
MQFDIVTIFPEYFEGPLRHGIVRRAQELGLLTVRVVDLRDFTGDRHRTVDDRPFGGGAGMVLKPEPLFAAVERLQAEGPRPRVILLSPGGELFSQQTAARLAALERVAILCGRYEGVDHRVTESLVDEELSVGDYVLSGGEPAAALIVDAVARLLPGALGNEESAAQESFSPSGAGALLEYPHYTRPAVFRGMAVPEVLLSGHHQQVNRWRRKKALEKTVARRPELLEKAALAEADQELLAEIIRERKHEPR